MFTALAAELAGPAAAGLTACELEDLLDERGREVLRQLLQDHFDLRAAREEQQAREQRCSRDGHRRDHPDPAGDRARQAAGHPVRHGAGDPVRLAQPGSGQLLPGRRRPVPAGRAALAFPGEAGRARGGPRLVRRRARGGRPPVRAGDRQAAARAGRDGCRRRYPRVLRRPGPGAVHAVDAGGPVRRLQGHRDAARGAAGRHREGRRPAGEDAHPAGVRGETEPQENGRPGHRLRRRAGEAPPARRDRPARRTARRPRAPARAQGPGQVAGRVRPRRTPPR